MGSDPALTALAVAGIALFAAAIVLLVVFAVVEARRWLRAFGIILRPGIGASPHGPNDGGVPLAPRSLRHRPGGRVEITVRSDLEVIDEAHELRPFLRRLLAEGRRDEAIRLYQALKGADDAAAVAAVDALAHDGG